MKNSIMFHYNGKTYGLSKYIGFKKEEFVKKDIQEIIGQTACPGKVSGKVKIVNVVEDMKKFKDGEILVSRSTNPSLILAMKKAAAFITDIGGLTCHAAIVSREMKKPCIIGTKIATKVLKDGDLVEVDANIGVVRILKIEPNWHLVVSFKTEPLSEYIIHKGYRESLPKFLPKVGLLRNRMIIDNDIYVDLNEVSQVQNILSKNLIEEASKIYEAIKNHSNKMLAIAKKIASNFKTVSNIELASRLKVFFNEYQTALGAIGIPTIIDLTLESKLKDILKQSGIKDIDNVLRQLAVSSKPVATTLERSDLLDIAIQAKKHGMISQKVKTLIKSHAEKYGWIYSTLFLGDPYTEQNINEEIKIILNKAKEEKERLQKERKADLKAANNVIKNLPKGKEEAKFLQMAVYIRTARLEWMNRACFIIRPLLEEIANRLNITYNDLIYLLPDELFDSLQKNSVQSYLDKVKERQNGYAMVSDDSNYHALFGGIELERLKEKFLIKTPIEEIKGIVARKGHVTGRVVIVRDRSELHKIQEGNVLVTPLTTPDFIIGMKKVAAIITDLGGLTSHAAIVSREMKKPCIVGTKIATKILKDGDLVEVDANKGIIKILKKKK
jgi:phosphoenolpyruvate synthase/pyruvate phosphate dikinase